MEFHDLLHGVISFDDGDDLTTLILDLVNSPEINRLRNMRQMNFDVPLIQELGRSRRLPHSIGVANLAFRLAKKSALSEEESRILIAAAILHDAAIPPYGHLVESEFKAVSPDFKHEKRVEGLIKGQISTDNKYQTIVPGRELGVRSILNKHQVDLEKVISVICPTEGKKSPISADLDLDNIDNVHRMAAMLGWTGAKENFQLLSGSLKVRGLGAMTFSKAAVEAVEKWLDFRQRIYTLIIAHPQCVPYNALQADLVRHAVRLKIITPDHWWLSEPEFEEALRQSDETKLLARQLISGCDYSLVDYVWIKNFEVTTKLHNANIISTLEFALPNPTDHGYFVWNEQGLISRAVRLQGDDWPGATLGRKSTSCMIALVKKTQGAAKLSKAHQQKWRREVLDIFSGMFNTHEFDVDFPETYTGSFWESKNNEIRLPF